MGTLGFRLRTASLRRRNEELFALVEERTRDLRAARDQALAGSQTKSAFLSNVSHELRTPLSAILGYAELLAEELATEAPKAVQDLERIQKAARHQLGLVNELLDLSKIESGRFELHVAPFSVKHLVEDVAETARPLIAPNGNQLSVVVAEGLDVMSGDETRLKQVLINLLGNACKFTTNGRISLYVGEDGADVRFQVADTGVGMSRAQLQRLFQPFMQADSRTAVVYGGTGLGLVIAQRFCELMGGDLTVTSEPERGSTFTARIPREAPAPFAAKRAKEPEAAS
jgi:signal transduction histidine kinase